MKCLRQYPILDLLFLGLIIYIMLGIWEEAPSPDSQDQTVIDLLNTMNENPERQIALSTVQGAINSCIAGVSIMLAAIAAVTGIKEKLDQKAKDHFRIAAIFCIISLFAGVWNMGVLPSLVRHNVAYDSSVGLFLVGQIWVCLLGGIRLLFAVIHTIKD